MYLVLPIIETAALRTLPRLKVWEETLLQAQHFINLSCFMHSYMSLGESRLCTSVYISIDYLQELEWLLSHGMLHGFCTTLPRAKASKKQMASRMTNCIHRLMDEEPCMDYGIL